MAGLPAGLPPPRRCNLQPRGEISSRGSRRTSGKTSFPYVVHYGLRGSSDSKGIGLPGYAVIIAVSILAGAIAAEIFLRYRNASRAPLPFYNCLYPYVMFRPYESYTYETQETYEMSHHKSRAFVYTNEDGFRISSPNYKLPKEKPAGQLRVAVLGGSLVQLASTFETTLPGSLKILLQRRYPGRDIEVINAGIQ